MVPVQAGGSHRRAVASEPQAYACLMVGVRLPEPDSIYPTAESGRPGEMLAEDKQRIGHLRS